MGQQRNRGRRSSLDEKKRRAAGRQQHEPEREAIRDAFAPEPDQKRARANTPARRPNAGRARPS